MPFYNPACARFSFYTTHGHYPRHCFLKSISSIPLGPSRIDPFTKYPLKYLASYNSWFVANTSHYCRPCSGRPRTRIRSAQDKTPKNEVWGTRIQERGSGAPRTKRLKTWPEERGLGMPRTKYPKTRPKERRSATKRPISTL